MTKGLIVLINGLVLGTLVGCSEVDSEDIRTSGFNVDATATTTDGSTNIFVRLELGDDFDSDRIVLTAGDTLVADLAGRRTELSRVNGSYRGSFDQVNGGEVLTLELLRPDDVSALDTRVLLPNSFEINAPDPTATFNAGETITVVWSPVDPENPMSIRYGVDCPLIENNTSFHAGRIGRTFEVADIGTHTVAINSILNVFDDQDQFVTGTPCPLEIELERENRGVIDPAFDDGSFEAIHRQVVVVSVTP